MSNFKTSISILALAAGLTIGFAPSTSFAQSAGAATAGQNIADYVNKQTSDINAINKAFPQPGATPAPAPAPSPQPAPSASSGPSGFPTTPTTTTTTTTTGATAPEPTWWESLKLKVKLMAIMLSSAVSSSKEEAKVPPKVEQPKTTAEAPHTTSKAALVLESKTFELKTAAVKTEAAEVLTSAGPLKLVTPGAQKPVELNLNTVEPMKLKIKEQAEALTPTTPLKLVTPGAHKPAELNLNTVEPMKAKIKEQVETPAPKPTATKLVLTDTIKAKTETAPRATVNVVTRFEANRPIVNVAHVAVNIPRPVVNIPHPVVTVPRINIPMIAIRR